jgi:hypothetical protein
MEEQQLEDTEAIAAASKPAKHVAKKRPEKKRTRALR